MAFAPIASQFPPLALSVGHVLVAALRVFVYFGFIAGIAIYLLMKLPHDGGE
ncbi:MAG: hypothetical protein J7M08_00900 [Planctomycetes bacterium]|nr:hypothetical protein [Planctomycetota bacterium]